MSVQSGAAGLMLVHSNQTSALRDVLLAWMRAHPLPPLQAEVVLVQSSGMAQWLRLGMAQDEADGGLGVCAALQPRLPSEFFWQAYRAVLGHDEVPEASAFDKPLLVWRLLRLLPQLCGQDAFAPLAHYLHDDADMRRRWQLAQRLADLFDQYQVYRADWLAAWAAGEDVLIDARGQRQPLPPAQHWQPHLWRSLLADVGPLQAEGSRAAIHQRFMQRVQALAEGTPLPGMPQRLLVFGLSSLPQQGLDVLAALARHMPVLMCVHNPCEYYWGNIIEGRDLLRATHPRHAPRANMPQELTEEDLHLHAHPLLAAWGRQGRDCMGMLDALDDRSRYEQRFAAIGQRVDLFGSHGTQTMLQQLQDDIRFLRPLAESRELWPPVDVQKDRSIRFAVAHSAQREVEALHDHLLATLAADATLQPRDVIVMVPDINAFAPHIRAVFGQYAADDARSIPFSLADQAQRQSDPLLAALETLLALPQSRAGVSEVLDLLEQPSLQRRFGLGVDSLPLLRRWIVQANIRWGLHVEHRRALGLEQAGHTNTWLFGLQRMLLGYATGDSAPWQDIAPLDEVGGLDAAALGALAELFGRLDAAWRDLSQPATPVQWQQRLQRLLDEFFAPVEGSTDVGVLLRLQQILAEWVGACESAALDEPLPPGVVAAHWLGALDQGGLHQRFMGGGVTFATLMPMRAIPFRHVCLLGMGDDSYPRRRTPVDFDLMGNDWRPGDRSRREDDRYLFLEALLSAQDGLYIGWTGRNIVDNSARAPSVLVAQLRDHLAQGWRLQGSGGDDGQALLQALTTQHRLQPFDGAYFNAADPRLFTYAREWSAAGDAPAQSLPQPLPAGPQQREPLSLAALQGFIAHPVRHFFQQRLGVFFSETQQDGQDEETFALDGLESWKLQEELVSVQLDAVRRGAQREVALQQRLEVMRLRGELPFGGFGERVCEQLAEPMAALFARYGRELARWPHSAGRQELRLEAPCSEGGAVLQVAGAVEPLRCNEGGALAMLALSDTALLTKEQTPKYRHDKMLSWWVTHLAACAAGLNLTTVVLSLRGDVCLPPLEPQKAQAHFACLLSAWAQGQCRPLPLPVHTALAWLAAQKGDAEAAWEKARACYEGSEGNHYSRPEGQDLFLARVWPAFDDLRSAHGGEFAELAQTLLAPLVEVVGDRAAPEKPGATA